jgi:CheY-like chemotaxis protein
MGQLTGGVAHDFNNLLTPIIGSLDMLQRRGDLDARLRRLVDGGLQSAERAKTLVQRLLAFARRQPLQPTAVDVVALVAGMADLVASTSGPAIKVMVDAQDDVPAARADPNQLEMALLNLAVNARDAMPDGGVLRISTSWAAAGESANLPGGPYVRIRVADTGTGMDDATLARAVEPFFSTKGIGQGTGLGLSMVHGLASQLNGGLFIDSAPGRGTIIDLWLPVAEGLMQPSLEAARARDAVSVRGSVLLVDDEELVRATTADMLIDLGFAVVEAASAEEALRLTEAGHRPDILVTDHLMPGLNGVQLIERMRRIIPGLPALLVSGYAETEGLGTDVPRLSKPFRQADLAESVSRIVETSTG